MECTKRTCEVYVGSSCGTSFSYACSLRGREESHSEKDGERVYKLVYEPKVCFYFFIIIFSYSKIFVFDNVEKYIGLAQCWSTAPRPSRRTK